MASPEGLNLAHDYDVLHDFVVDKAAVSGNMSWAEFRRQYIEKHSLVNYTRLLMSVVRDDSDIRFMDQKLAEIIYDR